MFNIIYESSNDRNGVEDYENSWNRALDFRPFEETDFEAVHAYASVAENVQYMVWGPNEKSHTKAFILQAIAKSKEIPCNNYQYAAVLKSSKKLIGACNLAILSDGEAEIGWILHRDYWKQGFGTETGNQILEFGFNELGLHRIMEAILKTVEALYICLV